MLRLASRTAPAREVERATILVGYAWCQRMATMTEQWKKWLLRSAAALAIIALVVVAWQRYGSPEREEGLAGSNGRIEAVEIDVATRIAGRLKEIRVKEGEFVTAGQVVALMDTDVLEAQRRQAEAQLQQAQSAVATARSQLAQRESDKAAAARRRFVTGVSLATQKVTKRRRAAALHRFCVLTIVDLRWLHETTRTE